MRASHLVLCVTGLMASAMQPRMARAEDASGAANRFELLAWASAVSTRDDTLVPLAFTGPALALGARYGYAARRHAFDAELRAGFGVLWNRFGHVAAQIFHGLSAGYAYALSDGAQRLALGGALRFDTDVAYLASWDDAHGYWLSALSLWPYVHDARPLGGFAWLESRAGFALFGLASRPPAYRANKQDALPHPGYYFDRIGQSPRWVGPLQVQAIELELLARFRRHRDAAGSGLGLGLRVRFARASDPAPFATLYTGAVVSYGFEL